jgi:hypothetical protein
MEAVIEEKRLDKKEGGCVFEEGLAAVHNTLDGT